MGMPERLAFILVKPPLYSAFSLSQYKSKKDPGLDGFVLSGKGALQMNECTGVFFLFFGACSMRGLSSISCSVLALLVFCVFGSLW